MVVGVIMVFMEVAVVVNGDEVLRLGNGEVEVALWFRLAKN